MPIALEGERVYRIGEALELAGLSRSTYFRWVREGRIRDVEYRDRNRRRVFTQEELQLVPASPQMTLLAKAVANG